MVRSVELESEVANQPGQTNVWASVAGSIYDSPVPVAGPTEKPALLPSLELVACSPAQDKPVSKPAEKPALIQEKPAYPSYNSPYVNPYEGYVAVEAKPAGKPGDKPALIREKPAYPSYNSPYVNPYEGYVAVEAKPAGKPGDKPAAIQEKPVYPSYNNPYANPYEGYVAVEAKPTGKPAEKPSAPYDAALPYSNPYANPYRIDGNPYGPPAEKPVQSSWQFPTGREVPQREFEHVVGQGEAEIQGNYILARRWRRDDGGLRREVFFDHSTRDRCISRAVDYHQDGRTVSQEVAFRPEMYIYSRTRTFAENGQPLRETTYRNDGRSSDSSFRNGQEYLCTEYDRENRRTARHVRENNVWTSQYFNTAGDVAQTVRNELGANDRVLRSTVSDAQGRVQQEWRYTPNGQRERYTEYYENGNPRRQIAYATDGRSTETNYRSNGSVELQPVRGTVAENYRFTRQDGTLEFRNAQGQVVRSESSGVATVHSYDAQGNRTMSRQDTPVRDLPFMPNLTEVPANRREQHLNFLTRRGDDLLRSFADREGQVNFRQHGRMLTRLAEQPDLTERDRLFILQHVVDEYNREPNRRFHLNREHAAPEVLNSFSADRLRHQVVGPADSYHPPLGAMSDVQAAITIMRHEGPLKMLGNFGRLLLDLDGGGIGFNHGDAMASIYQAACWRQHLQQGFRAYATSWNGLYVR